VKLNVNKLYIKLIKFDFMFMLIFKILTNLLHKVPINLSLTLN